MVETVVGGLIPWHVPEGRVEPLRTPKPDTPDGRVEWLLERRKGIGSSDASAVLGMGRTTPHSLWLDKTGRMPLDLADNEAMEWGRRLEPIVREAATERLGYEYVHLPGMMRSVQYPWMLSNLDGAYYEHNAILECKNQTEWLRADWDDEQVPDHAELQVVHSLAVTGADHGYVAGLIGGNRLRIVRIDRDEELIAYLIEEERRFWHDYVLADVAPPITYRDSVDQILGAAPATTEDVLPVDPKLADTLLYWRAQYEEARDAEAESKKRKSEATNNIVALLGQHTLAVDEHGQPVVKLQRGGISKSRFAEEYPEIADVSMKKIETLDLDVIKNEHPDEYRKHQSRAVKVPGKTDYKTAAEWFAKQREGSDG
ncbi:RecE-like exonuclease [Gordonia phage Lilbeanie]|uniref:RecE-like exonuclease n=1 Tax=Gordonia phage Lilbeanie TaxID=2794947 RepID=A0A7T1KSA4_9CAUD|nr:RecE-like recombination exonuclease [Gordonia phage Lilbeanie]QPO17129.1 RecE-like exonuclease [Gordonia phage Lilbeanie]